MTNLLRNGEDTTPALFWFTTECIRIQSPTHTITRNSHEGW